MGENDLKTLQDTYYAIIIKKVVIGDGKFLYVPLSTIIGEIDENGIFTSENDDKYYPVEMPEFNFSEKEIGYCYSYSLYDLVQTYKTNDIGTIDNVYNYVKDNCLFSSKFDEENHKMIINSFEKDELFPKMDLKEKTVEEPKEESNNLEEIKEIKTDSSVEDEKEEEIERLKNIRDLYKELNKRIVGQEAAKATLISSLYLDTKSRCFLVGPSGSGKTEILSTIKDVYRYPVVSVNVKDIYNYNNMGEFSLNMQQYIIDLINKAEGDVTKAEHGIIILEDIDKIKSRDVREAIVDELSDFSSQKTYRLFCSVDGAQQIIDFDTSHLSIIASGTFKELVDAKRDGREFRHMGFATSDKNKANSNGEINLTSEDISASGAMGSKFPQVFDSVATLHKHSINELKKILTDSYISPLKMNINKFKKDNIIFEYDENFIDAIALKAYKSKNDGKALKSILDKITHKIIIKFISSDEYNIGDEIHIYGRVLDDSPVIMTEEEKMKYDEKPKVKTLTTASKK